MYKISIIIPVFNREKQLKYAIESVLTQTMDINDIELILIDDDSTDKSKNIIEDYVDKHDNIKGIFLKTNSGPGNARNIGIKNSNGKYLMSLDSDDAFTEDICEILYNKITKENADVVFSNSYYTFADEDNNPKNRKLYKKPFNYRIIIDNQYEESVVFENNNLKNWDKNKLLYPAIYKSSLVKDNNIKFSNARIAEDMFFLLDLILSANKIVYLHDFFSRYYSIDTFNSLSHSNTQKSILDSIYGYSLIVNLLKNKYPSNLQYVGNDFIEQILIKLLKSNESYTITKELVNDINNFEKEYDYPIHLESKIFSFINYLIIKRKYKSIFLIIKLIGLLFRINIIEQIIRDRNRNLIEISSKN